MDPVLCVMIGLVAGGVLGGVVGWLWARKTARASAADPRVEQELRAQLDGVKTELARANEARLAAEKALSAAEARAAAGAERLVEEERRARESLALLREGHERSLAQMRDAFAALSSEALKNLQPQFLALANETLAKQAEGAKGDLAQRQESIAAMLKPMEEMLRTYQERLAQGATTQSTALGEVRKQLETLAQHSASLSGETLQLRRVLGSSQARGRWGEETLRRVVEASGMSSHCDFETQTQADDKRPDMVVRLPGDRLIIIDAKVPDLDFLAALHEGDEVRRAEALKVHADKLRGTIKALAERDYPAKYQNALDHVVLFLPAESLFSAALEGDRGLIVWAAERRIMLATPASLIALLRSVSVTWQQHDQAANAKEIADAAGELFSRVATFAKHFDTIRAGLSKATEAYNDAVGSYERSVRPQGERLLKLGAASGGKQLPEVAVVSDSLRLAPAGRN